MSAHITDDHDSTVERVRAALRARANLVTDDDLRPSLDLPRQRERQRWPVLVAAAAAVVAILLVAAVVSLRSDRRLEPAGPPPGEEPGLGLQTESVEGEGPMAIPGPPPLDELPCPLRKGVVRSVEAGGDLLEIVGDEFIPKTAHDCPPPDYRNWVLRVKGGEVLARGAGKASRTGHLKGLSGGVKPYLWAGSLQCEQINEAAFCLLQGHDDERVSSLYALRRTSAGWAFETRFELPQASDWPQVVRLTGGTVGVAVARNEPSNRPRSWWLQVWRWEGKALGCTPYEPSPPKPPTSVDPETLTPECGGAPLPDGTR